MNLFLHFSDAAKFADVARNLITHGEYGSTFRFWNDNITNTFTGNLFSADWISPVTPLTIAFFLKFLGMNDVSVIFTSIFYFCLALLFVYLLSKKLYKSNLTSFLSLLVVGFNYNLVNYALTGASESPFVFELLAATYFLSLKKKWGNVVGAVFMVLMYFTRPQAIIYIFGLILYFFINNFKLKRGLIYTLITFIFGTFLYFIFAKQGLIAATQNIPGVAVSDSLRGSVVNFNILTIVKKVFYNLYNFYKALPEIINPYLFTLFLIGLIKRPSPFRISVLFMTLLTFFVTALTIPFYRYLHPIIPLIYIVAIGTLVKMFDKNKYKVLITSFLVLFFAVGQTIGIIFLDSRFEKKLHNVDKAPIYVEMSWKLKEITGNDDVVLTNLDTWGSWYGERKTIWFPLEPSMILPKQDSIDAIYLTSYKMDDENYYMGEKWREIFLDPKNQKILPEYKFVAEYQFKSEDNYEKENGRAILLKRIK